MEFTIEVIPVPVTDVDRAKAFYTDACGFRLDLDQEVAPGVRIVQMTPPGSRCSVALMKGMPPMPGQRDMAPGELRGIQMCVTDIVAAREELAGRGVPVSAVLRLGPNGWEEGHSGEDWTSFATFDDPDGNGWVLQEAPAPLSERH